MTARALRLALLAAAAAAAAGAVPGAAGALARGGYCGTDPAAPGDTYFPAYAGGAEGARLVHSQVLIRHGDRTVAGRTTCWPADTSKINCSLSHASVPNDQPGVPTARVPRLFRKRYEELSIGNCNWGELTNQGFEQQTVHGGMMRDAYVGTLLSGDPAAAAREVLIRSDDVPRTILSVESLFGGLYPNGTSQPAGSVDVVELWTTETLRGIMFPNTYMCPPLADLVREVEASAAFRKFLADSQPVLRAMGEALGENITATRAGSVFDCLHVHNCHGLHIPAGVTQELMDSFSDVVFRYQMFSFQNPNRTLAGRLNIGPLFSKMYTHLRAAVTGEPGEPRLVLFSGHDTTVMPVLAALGVPPPHWTPYASAMAVELYELASGSLAGRVLYNGGEMTLPDCTYVDGLCDAGTLLSIFKNLVPSRDECPGMYDDY